ncbi:hypothetical protein [Asanoa sp. NPDC050611]|uniref:hypothetical protein n=1 Tax=Asanoa sp. NPDC050611 TaxID=3157098 RepID=UPI003400B879
MLELTDGSFAVIGLDVTADLDGELGEVQAARGVEERIVRLPRDVMLAALRDLQKSVN